MEVQSATCGPYPTTGGAPAGTNLWVILGQDRRQVAPGLDYYYAELVLQHHPTRREVERGQENEGTWWNVDVSCRGRSSPPTPMPVKYLAKIWESKSGVHRQVQDGHGAVIGPNAIYSIMEYVQDPNYRPPPSGAPTKLFICCDQYSGKQVEELQKWHGEVWQPGPDVVSVLDQHGDGSTQEAARLQSAWFAQSLHKTVVSRVNGFRWEFDASRSSVGAKVREGLTDGANKISDVLY